jgi:hypothetical protein
MNPRIPSTTPGKKNQIKNPTIARGIIYITSTRSLFEENIVLVITNIRYPVSQTGRCQFTMNQIAKSPNGKGASPTMILRHKPLFSYSTCPSLIDL